MTQPNDITGSRERTPSRWPRVPELPPEFRVFAGALLSVLVMPLIPLALDWMFKGEVECRTLAFAAAMYGIGVGSSSRSFEQFLLFIVLGLVLAGAGAQMGAEPGSLVSPGVPVQTEHQHFWLHGLSWAMIAFTAVLHSVERYTRHVLDLEPAFEFFRRKET